MTERDHRIPQLILSVGTQVVTLRDIVGDGGIVKHPRGSVGVIIKSPYDGEHSYRVRFPGGAEQALRSTDFVMLAQFKESQIGDSPTAGETNQLMDRVIYRCIIGSRAYGLDEADSDVDYRGIYLPTADDQWSLFGIPTQVERQETQEHYWELQRFMVLALKANPNVLECLYAPMVEKSTPLAEELLAMRSIFLSRLVYQTFNGYVLSQFRKMQADLRNQGAVKWKHVMHLIRLLISGIQILRDGIVEIRVDEHRDRLLAIRRGELSTTEIEAWRLSLHTQLDKAFAETKLPERPDYMQANSFLLRARRAALAEELP